MSKPKQMRFALEVWSSDYEELEATCLLAESLGLDGFYYGESPNSLNLDCWTTLAALARSTTRIRLGPVITNVLPTYRSTVLLAKQAATVHAISGGRLDLRTGVGASVAYGRPWWEPFGIEYPEYDQRLHDVRSALEVLPGLLADEDDVPITIAARGERAMRLAAEHAAVWETSFCTPEEFRVQRARMDGIRASKNLVSSLEVDGFISSSGAGRDALLSRVQSERGRAEDLAPVLERAIVGVPEDAAAQFLELVDAGVDQVVVALHEPHDPDALAALAAAADLVRSQNVEPGTRS